MHPIRQTPTTRGGGWQSCTHGPTWSEAWLISLGSRGTNFENLACAFGATHMPMHRSCPPQSLVVDFEIRRPAGCDHFGSAPPDFYRDRPLTSAHDHSSAAEAPSSSKPPGEAAEELDGIRVWSAVSRPNKRLVLDVLSLDLARMRTYSP